MRRDNGRVKILVYRKPTHTDQYLSYESHHPLVHKLGVIRTLITKTSSWTKRTDAEEQHIIKAVMTWGYPKWTFNRVKQAEVRKQQKSKRKSQRMPKNLKAW